MNNRKAFNFYRSYFEVLAELGDKDKLEFLMALLELQFTGKSRELTGMAKFAFMSQKHSINAQIEGYLAKVGGSIPPTEGPTVPPSVQEKGKVQGQEKGQEKAQAGEIIEINKVDGVSDFITILPKVIGERKYRIWGVDGLNHLYQMHMSAIPYPEHATKFMSRNRGKPFEDFKHVFNSFNKFVEKQYQ